jgi:predicted hotdog family 3-hydroxylacyl-ACP dehydratase
MQLDRAGIATRIPHQGSMCLLDRVLEWDDNRIRCAAASHRAGDNPLRAHGRLAAACGIEYAAQAMAVHGALCAAAYARVGAAGAVVEGAPTPRMGMLTSVRGVDLQVARLDDIAADLVVQAERVSGDRNAIVYEFTLRADDRILVSGRATVILDIDAMRDSG